MKKELLMYVLILCFCSLGILPIAQASGEKDESTATLPLSEILRLYRETQQTPPDPMQPAPIPAAVESIEIEGQLQENRIEFKAHFRVVVLDESEWTTLPLLESDERLHISQLPHFEHGVIVQKKGYLTFITQKAGTYNFEISMVKQAQFEQEKRLVSLRSVPSTKLEMRLKFDRELFDLIGPQSVRFQEGVVIYPNNNEFLIQWQHKEKVSEIRQQEMKRQEMKRPPVESMIRQAHVSSVSTLEGELLTRVLYVLGFEGTQSLVIQIPPEYELKKVYLDRLAVPFEVENQQVVLELAASYAEGQMGIAELVLARNQGKFHLSGHLAFQVPKVSWPIHNLIMDLYLPDVFNYSHTGGSLSVMSSAPEAVFTYDLPTPGKRLSFQQDLITDSAPSLEMGYTIDLRDKYFTGD